MATSDPTHDKDSRFDSLLEAAIEAEYETGRREDSVAKAKRNIVLRVGSVVAGVVILLVGIAMLVLPGPGIAMMILGLALIAPEVPFADRMLKKLKARLPQDEAGGIDKRVLVVSIALFVVFTAGSIYLAVQKATGS